MDISPHNFDSSCASSSPAFCMMYSAYKLNKQGDNIQPWYTHFPIFNQSIFPCPVLTVASWPAYRFLRRQVRWSGIPISKNCPQFVVIHTVKGFCLVHEAKVDAFLESPYIFDTYCLKRVSNSTSRDKEPTRKQASFLIQWDTISHLGGNQVARVCRTEGQREDERAGAELGCEEALPEGSAVYASVHVCEETA